MEVEGYIPYLTDYNWPTYDNSAAAPSVVDQRAIPDLLVNALGAHGLQPVVERSSSDNAVATIS